MVIVIVQPMHSRLLDPCCDVRYDFRITTMFYTPICAVKGSYFINAIFIICLYPQFKSSDICIAVGVNSEVRSDSPSEASELTPVLSEVLLAECFTFCVLFSISFLLCLPFFFLFSVFIRFTASVYPVDIVNMHYMTSHFHTRIK